MDVNETWRRLSIQLYTETHIIVKARENQKGQSRMDNLETLATLGTQDTKQSQTKHKNTA